MGGWTVSPGGFVWGELGVGFLLIEGERGGRLTSIFTVPVALFVEAIVFQGYADVKSVGGISAWEEEEEEEEGVK